MSQGKRWCFTLNNYNDEDFDSIKGWSCKYLVVGKETAETGTPHLQGFIIFDTNHRFSAVRILSDRAHWEIARSNSRAASDYCKKDGDFFEKGVLNCQGSRTDLQRAIETLKAEGLAAVAKQHTETFVKYSRGFKDVSLFLQDPYEHTDVRGWWIYGPPGTGKSHIARQFSDSLFCKDQNKWWDGYDGELNVLLDDLDSNTLGHLLKIWADKYACKGETKGGTIYLRHHRFIVTSNYSPEELWPEDVAMCDAISRRFRIFYKNELEDTVDFNF